MRALLVTLLLFSSLARANSLASIYNGSQYQLDGQLLVQDADNSNNYYYVPQAFRLKQSSQWDAKKQAYVPDYGIHREVITKAGRQYASYTMRFELDEPSESDVLTATMNLAVKTSPLVQILGMAQICGLSLAVPGFATAPPAPPDPDATVIRYSINSTDAGKCNSLVSLNEFSMSLTVPLERDHEYLNNFISPNGPVLPPVEMILPYKYKDRVIVSVDAHAALDQAKAAVGVGFTYEAVTAAVNASMENLWRSLTASGQVYVDCQNDDHTICDRFVQQAQDLLAKSIFLITPDMSKGDTNPLVVGDNNKASSANLFKIQLGYDEQHLSDNQKLTVDFTNVVYSSVRAQAQVIASGVPADVLGVPAPK